LPNRANAETAVHQRFGEMVLTHQRHRFRRHDAHAVKLALVEQRLREVRIVLKRRNESTAAHRHRRRRKIVALIGGRSSATRPRELVVRYSVASRPRFSGGTKKAVSTMPSGSSNFVRMKSGRLWPLSTSMIAPCISIDRL
jgi:hypothetical protein